MCSLYLAGSKPFGFILENRLFIRKDRVMKAQGETKKISKERRGSKRKSDSKDREASLRKYQIIIRSMMALSVVGMLLFGILLLQSRREYAKGDALYEQIQMTSWDGNEVETDKKIGSDGFLVDFAMLQEINEDVIGWLQDGEGTIDYPVVLGEDNEYYLTHLFNHEQNKLGTLFMDCRNEGGLTDKNTVIYGHNMKDGSMFATLLNYRDQSYYESFPMMTLYTPEGDFTIEFFAGIVADGNYEFIRFQFKDNADFQNYIDIIKEKSTFESDVEVGPEHRIVTLCTCSYEFDNARYALYGKLVPIE